MNAITQRIAEVVPETERREQSKTHMLKMYATYSLHWKLFFCASDTKLTTALSVIDKLLKMQQMEEGAVARKTFP